MEILGVLNTLPLPLKSDPIKPGGVIPLRIRFMVEIELINILLKIFIILLVSFFKPT